jgi:acetyl esterase/lipase/plastocyanin
LPAKSIRVGANGVLAVSTIVALLLGPLASSAPAQPQAPGAVTIQKVANVVYKTVGPVQIKLDIYVPSGPGMTGPFPGLLMIHGGGWADSNKSDITSYAQDFAALGFVTYAADFRESCDPSNPGTGDDPALCGYLFPTHEEDLRDAIVWIRTSAPLHPEWKTMADRVGVWGTSSGANIAGSLATGWNYTGGAEGTPGWDKPDAWVDWAGAMDMVNGGGQPAETGRIASYLGCHPYDDPTDCTDPFITYKSSPLYNLTSDDPPAFLMGASQDPILPVDQHAVAMYDAMQALSLPSELYIVQGACHGVKCVVVDPTLEQHTADWLHSILGPRQPTVSITGAPDASTPLGQATFTFTAGPGVTTQCGLDGGALSPCTSPITAQNLQPGQHSFLVQGTDGTGTGDPSTYTWTVAPRTVSITNTGFNPSALSSVLRGSLVTWTNNGTGQHTVTDSSGMSLFNSGSLPQGRTFTQSFVGAGIYPYTSTTDSQMNGKVKVPIAISPTTLAPGQSYTVTWGATAPPSGYSFDVQFKKPGGTSWKNWQNAVTTTSAVVSTSTNTAQGTWNYRGRLRKNANAATSNWSATAAVTVTIADVTPPSVTITSGPSSPSTSSSATFTYAADETVTFACAIDGGAFASCPATGVTYSALAVGSHTFGAQATDGAGNVSSPMTWTWYISNTAGAAVSESGFTPGTLTVPFGTTVQWTNTGTQPHTVTDSGPVALFDSGSIAPTGIFQFFFNGASTYTVASAIDAGVTQSVKVPPQVSPAAGTTTTSFTVSWAALAPPPNLLFDVYIKRPGSSSVVLWQLGNSGTSAQFVPDAGPGTYSFLVRLRNLADVAEPFSPAVSISVG